MVGFSFWADSIDSRVYLTRSIFKIIIERRSMRVLTISLLLSSLLMAKNCTYKTYAWNVNLKSAVDFKKVVHSYDLVTSLERDEASGCTVCLEDQQEIRLPNIIPFKVCKYKALEIEGIIMDAIHAGKEIQSVIGYRVGLTRGTVDSKGSRTEFSNHSFGIAVDINPQYNGLYDHCKEFSPSCRLRKGGHWHPTHPKSLHKEDMIVKNFHAHGFQWGGEIYGWQKDFMHFSPTGY